MAENNCNLQNPAVFNCSIELKIEHFEHFEHLCLFYKSLKMNVLLFCKQILSSQKAFNLNNKLNTFAVPVPEKS